MPKILNTRNKSEKVGIVILKDCLILSHQKLKKTLIAYPKFYFFEFKGKNVT